MNAPLSILQLRMLIRNDEAKIEHLTGVINRLEPEESIDGLFERCSRAHANLETHQRALHALLNPARPIEWTTAHL